MQCGEARRKKEVSMHGISVFCQYAEGAHLYKTDD